MRKFSPIVFFILLQSHFVLSQTETTLKVRAYCEKNQHRIIKEFSSFLSIPNVAADTIALRQNAHTIISMMWARNIQNVQLLYPGVDSAPPAVYGEWKVPNAKSTIIFYAHYDGQPVNPAQWRQGLQPFKPTLVRGNLADGAEIISWPDSSKRFLPDWRIYARGASDDKGGVMAILNAFDALRSTGQQAGCNIKFFFEGEEEAGSTHLDRILELNKDLLRSDLWLICDGPVDLSGKKQVSFGVRGDTHLELTVYGPIRPLHSGHYGNWAQNPALMLSRLLASMKDENGKVLVAHFYDDVKPVSPEEKKAIAEMPNMDEKMKKELGIATVEIPGKSLMESKMLPSLNINGMSSGNTGKMASNMIPTTAIADIDLRLVPGNDWQKQQQKVIDHIKAQGFYVLDREPTQEERIKYGKLIKVSRSDGYNAQRTPLDLPISKKVAEAVNGTTPDGVVLVPTMGGSLPLYVFEKILNAKTLTVGIANPDNNQHAENENIRLRNFWEGIETMAALMTFKGY